jgi:ribosomal protein S18 acetylase RimI-like enzyme
MEYVIGTPSGYSSTRSLYSSPESLGKGDYWLAVYHGKELIGSLRVEKYQDTYVIREVVVSPEYRGKGIGRRMMEHILTFLKPKDTPIFLYVNAENKIAVKLYTSLGFVLRKKGARWGDKYQYKE